MTAEAVLDGVKTRISTQFETYRAALAGEIAATIPTYKTLEIGDVLNPPTPSIELLPASTDVELYDGQTLDDGMETYGITLRVTAAGTKTTEVTRLLMRYREILRRIIQADPTFASVFYRVQLSRTDWSIMTRAQEAQKFAQEMYQDINVLVSY